MATIRPSRMPIDVSRTPSTASSTSVLVMTTSHDSSVRTARSPMPSRPVLANPMSSSSPGSRSSVATRTVRPVSPRRTRSPCRGPCTVTSPGDPPLTLVAPLGARPGQPRLAQRPPPPGVGCRGPRCRRTRRHVPWPAPPRPHRERRWGRPPARRSRRRRARPRWARDRLVVGRPARM